MDCGKPARPVIQRTGQHDADHTPVAMSSNGAEKEIDRAVTMNARGIVYNLDETSRCQRQMLCGLSDIDASLLETLSFVGDQDRVSAASGEDLL